MMPEDRKYCLCTECPIPHYENCPDCYGWGVRITTPSGEIMATSIPVSAYYAHERRFDAAHQPCPTCGIVLESKRSDGAVWVRVRPTSEQIRKPAPEIVRPVVPARERREVPLGIRWNVLERDGHRCRSCGAGAEDAKLVIDHIKPFSKGGPTVEANLQTLCFECNSGKRDKYVEGSP